MKIKLFYVQSDREAKIKETVKMVEDFCNEDGRDILDVSCCGNVTGISTNSRACSFGMCLFVVKYK